MQKKKALVLCSGGIDSAVCLHYYLQRKYNVHALFINYGQKNNEREKQAAKKISKHFNVSLKIIEIYNIPWGISSKSKEYFGRNLTLISIALNLFKKNESGIISTGIHTDSIYRDCSMAFLEFADQLVDYLSNGIIRLDSPLAKFDKSLILEYALNANIPLGLTYSCDNNSKTYCRRCPSCRELIIASKKLNLSFPSFVRFVTHT